MLFIVPMRYLVEDDTCNPLPGFVPTYKTVGAEQSPGCRLYPEVGCRDCVQARARARACPLSPLRFDLVFAALAPALFPWQVHLPGKGFDEVSWEPATFDPGLWGPAEAAAERGVVAFL